MDMARGYLVKYETILNGGKLHKSPPFLSDKNMELLPWND
jgi:hypothetical protein